VTWQCAGQRNSTPDCKLVVAEDAESDVEPETDDIVGVPIEEVRVYDTDEAAVTATAITGRMTVTDETAGSVQSVSGRFSETDEAAGRSRATVEVDVQSVLSILIMRCVLNVTCSSTF